MKNHDWQMAKNNEPGWTNLAVGEPYFLQHYLYNRSVLTYALGTDVLPTQTAYPPFSGNADTIAEIKRYYGKDYKHIIITNGAKQAISAAFYAAREIRKARGVDHPIPYWPSYPTLAYELGLAFNADINDTISCITTPNNPNGDQSFDPNTKYFLWDAAYAHSVYGFRGRKPVHEIAVFSMAKTLGLSGLRVGFAATNDDDLARAMAYFVEISTSGVSIASQFILSRLLDVASNYQVEVERLYRNARQCLNSNADTFNTLITPYCTKVSDLRSGMFAWFQPADLERFNMAITASKIKLVTGEACGGSPDHFRMSLGLKASEFHQAMLELNCNYNNLG